MMKKLMIVTALMTALMGASAAFAEESKEKDSKSISFEEAEKMEQLSEQEKKQKGAGLKQQLNKLNRLKKIGEGVYDIGQAGGFIASCVVVPGECTRENTPQWKSPVNQKVQKYLDRH